MDFEFSTRKLERLYTEEFGSSKYPPKVVDAFFEVMAAVETARDERDLRALKHLHFEKLKAQRKHQRSLALHGGFRLIVRLLEGDEGKVLAIDEIVDYHKG